MTYLYQVIRTWFIEGFLDRWLPLKAKAAAAWKKLRARNTGDR